MQFKTQATMKQKKNKTVQYTKCYLQNTKKKQKKKRKHKINKLVM